MDINISVKKGHLVVFVLVLIGVLGVGYVIAFNPGGVADPSKFGHSLNEISFSDVEKVSDQRITPTYFNTASTQYHEVSCPAGKIAIGGGGECSSGGLIDCWFLTTNRAVFDGAGKPNGWKVGCQGTNGGGCVTTISVEALCVPG